MGFLIIIPVNYVYVCWTFSHQKWDFKVKSETNHHFLMYIQLTHHDLLRAMGLLYSIAATLIRQHDEAPWSSSTTLHAGAHNYDNEHIMYSTLRTWRDPIQYSWFKICIFSSQNHPFFSYFVVYWSGFKKVGQKGVKVGQWDRGWRGGGGPGGPDPPFLTRPSFAYRIFTRSDTALQ